MDNKELKKWIEEGFNNFNAPLIFKYSDNPFLSRQYTKEIAKKLNLEILHINSLSEIDSDSSFFDEVLPYLYVYDIEKLQENVTDKYKNLIVIAKTLPDKLDIDYIDMLKIQDWQIEDFIHSRLKGLSNEEIKWLCEASKYDIYRLDNEAKKIEIFNESQQKIIFNQLNSDNGYCDLNPLTIFNFSNAIMKKDLSTINASLQDLKYIDIEATGLITILYGQFKKLIDIQFNPRATADLLGMKPGQFYAIKQNVGIYTNEELINIFNFLTSFDEQLKKGNLSLDPENRKNNNKLVDYITMKILAAGV